MTPHGQFPITNWAPENTLLEICQLNRIPPSAISFYSEEGGELELVTDLLSQVGDLLPSTKKLVIRPDRNINYHEIIPTSIVSDLSADDVSEYFLPSNGNTHLHKGLSEEECTKHIYRRVAEAVEEYGAALKEQPVVVGVSGGGDSNVLVGSLIYSGISDIRPVMMLGIPDWDKGRQRAKDICDAHDLTLRYVEKDSVGKLLGAAPNHDWVKGFEDVYPDVDLEMLGTLAVRLVLASVAEEDGIEVCITGLNLEDLLAEAFMCILEGELPLSFPQRAIGNVNFFYPMYLCPKKIIDGCFPKYSLANYEDRYPSRLRGRALAYYLAQSMNGLIPGIEFDLARGLSKVSGKFDGWDSAHIDPDFGFTVLRPISPEAKLRWSAFLGHSAH